MPRSIQVRPAYFNSRPCGRGFYLLTAPCPALYISIHAPAGGASLYSFRMPSTRLFQFTPLREGLRSQMYHLINFCTISIHAPAGGASPCPVPVHILSRLFQFTPLREGLRFCLLIRIFVMPYFNSRPCGRGFGHHHKPLHLSCNFNSRPCGRGFHYPGEKALPRIYFNSRPCGRGFV